MAIQIPSGEKSSVKAVFKDLVFVNLQLPFREDTGTYRGSVSSAGMRYMAHWGYHDLMYLLLFLNSVVEKMICLLNKLLSEMGPF